MNIYKEVLDFSLRLVPISALKVQGVGFNEIEHSHWSRALNWSQGL